MTIANLLQAMWNKIPEDQRPTKVKAALAKIPKASRGEWALPEKFMVRANELATEPAAAA